ncbi:hypothetical protein [Buchnera aphidicola]|uniref:Uncharacterized protein n=1 Tax=Buchnera aphidicola (Aphis nerii) TaxID=1241835 RepID=A0A4D6XZP0_9GAMM|nr:hypothetical protein [Buchnera aphidicola]QCI19091.1 hypothetical protein D9V64_02975 [Buchnera aphidicola (Aphis nerii)]
MDFIKDTFSNLNIIKISKEIFDKVLETISIAYKAVKNEIFNLFNGTTFKKIFDAGYRFIVGSSMDESTKKVNDRIDSLVKYVAKLKKTIEASKAFIHILIEKIREEGRLKIVNKLNHNPKHPEYESSFPDLNIEDPKEEKLKILDQNNLDENFDENLDIQVNEGNLKINSKFKHGINENIEKSEYNYFTNNTNSSSIFNYPLSSEKINNAATISSFQNVFETFTLPKHLDTNFMIDFHFADFLIDGKLISSSTKSKMLESFQKLIKTDTEQKIISIYANPMLLKKSYLKLIAKHPELNNVQVVRGKNFYEINHLKDGTIRIIDTNLSDFYSINSNNVKENHTFGVKTSIIFSYIEEPKIEYSYFVH